MQSVAASGLRAQLPLRAAKGCRVQRLAISCGAAPQRRQQAAAYQPSAATTLALSSLLLGMGSAPARAEEAESVVAAAADAGNAVAAAVDAAAAPGGVTLVGWTLVLSPILFYGAFNLYRSQVDPKAKFGDAVFVLAALLIVSNIICITVFKIRLW